MSTFAQIAPSPGGPALWVAVGLLVGVFAGLVVRGEAGGVIRDVAAGVSHHGNARIFVAAGMALDLSPA